MSDFTEETVLKYGAECVQKGYNKALSDNALALKLWGKIKLIPGQCETEKKKGKYIYITRCVFLNEDDNCVLNFNEKKCIKFFSTEKEAE